MIMYKLFQEEGFWIAQGIKYDIVAQGATENEARQRFFLTYDAEVAYCKEKGIEMPLYEKS